MQEWDPGGEEEGTVILEHQSKCDKFQRPKEMLCIAAIFLREIMLCIARSSHTEIC